jgi:polyisoprenoid-binding protein YceI
MTTRIPITVFLLFFAAMPSLFAQTTWNFDKSHTSIGFSVTHLLITDVEGRFNDFGGSIVTNGDGFENARVDFSANVASIDTDNEKRDNHLRSDDFFNAQKYPKLKFEGKSMKKVGENAYKLTGDLTIRDVTKTVTLDVAFKGMVKDPWGNTKAGFRITGEVNRFDYNLKWNTLTEAGGAVVGKTVSLIINVQLVKSA